MNRKLNEECGVFGFYDNDGYNVARTIYYGLYALQHRGQQSCGMALNGNDIENVFNYYKNVGLVNEVFDEQKLAGLNGKIGVGHVRYAPELAPSRENAQPLVSKYIKGCLAVAFNGSLINAKQVRGELEKRGAVFQSSNDAEVIMHLAAIARTQSANIEGAMLEVVKQLEGAYSIVVMSPNKLIGIRDPQGFRPLCLGKLKNSFVLASETVALDVIGAEFVRDIEPGELVLINKEGVTSFKNYCGLVPSLCVFEYIYFARPDSIIDGISVYKSRVEAGKLLAKANPVDADIIVGVPDSGLNFAVGFAQQSGIPYGEGFIKNRYTGRTFIKPKQSDREMAVSIKLNVLKSNIEGKRVVVVDDSIVRGTTCANIIKMLKNAGATEVHMRVASPPFMWPCYFGTDIPNRKDLIAVKYSQEEIRQKIGADTLGYLPQDDVFKIGLKENFGYCNACFSGKYPVRIPLHLQEKINAKD